jgi:hypothetical protein
MKKYVNFIINTSDFKALTEIEELFLFEFVIFNWNSLRMGEFALRIF